MWGHFREHPPPSQPQSQACLGCKAGLHHLPLVSNGSRVRPAPSFTLCLIQASFFLN